MNLEIGCPEAEAAVLGCLLRLSSTRARWLTTQLEPEDFSDPRHRLVLSGAIHTLERNAAPDPVTVLGELRRLGLEPSFLANQNAGVFLAELYAAAPAPVNLNHYLAIVLEHRARRRFQEAAERWQQVAGSASLEDLRATVTTDMQQVVRHLDRAAGSLGACTATEATK